MKFYLFIFMTLLIACSDSTNFVHDVPSVNLYSLEKCDFYTLDEQCLIYEKEVFEVPPVVPLDIVFVLDVSQSMYPVLEKVGQGFNQLIESIDTFDWQMAFTTADHGDQLFYCEDDQLNEEGTDCLPGYKREFPPSAKWQDFKGTLPYFGRFMPLQSNTEILSQNILNKNFENPNKVFQETLTHPAGSSVDVFCSEPPFCQAGNEQPLRVLKSVFSQAQTTHKDFFRKNVGVVAFVVTNEPERVEDQNQATTTREVMGEFKKVFDSPDKKLIVYSISVKTAECLEQQRQLSTSVHHSDELQNLVEQTNGKSEDLCLEDYSQTFSEISEHIHGRIRSFSLAFTPTVIPRENVHIDIVITAPDGTKKKVLWKGEVRGKEISFDKDILPNSKIEVQYFYNKNAHRRSSST